MEPVYYEPPPEHEQHLAAAWKWLTIFFVTLVLVIAVFVMSAHRIVVLLPFSVEQRFVRPYEALSEYFADEERDSEALYVEDYLGGLVSELAGHMELAPEFVLQVHYLDTPEINAFATLGGHLFVFRGLIGALPDENSLAMVLAHEIAHIRNRDPIVSLGRGVALQVLYSFVTGSYSSVDVAAYGGNLGLLHFSREQEREADQLGVAALERMYGHVAGIDTIFRVMREGEHIDADALAQWFSTHPDLDDRIAEINAFAVRRSWAAGASTPIPSRVVRAAADAD